SFSCVKEGPTLADATNATLILTNIQVADAGSYVALVTNVAGAATSGVAMLIVDARPLIATQPDNLILAPGASGTLSVSATGPALSYRWLRDDLTLPAATNATLTISNAGPAERGSYQVIITNSFGSIT